MFYFLDFEYSTVSMSAVPPTQIDRERIKNFKMLVIDATDDRLYAHDKILPIHRAQIVKDDQGNEYHDCAKEKIST